MGFKRIFWRILFFAYGATAVAASSFLHVFYMPTEWQKSREVLSPCSWNCHGVHEVTTIPVWPSNQHFVRQHPQISQNLFHYHFFLESAGGLPNVSSVMWYLIIGAGFFLCGRRLKHSRLIRIDWRARDNGLVSSDMSVTLANYSWFCLTVYPY